MQGRRARAQRRPRPADRRRGPRGRAGLGQGRRRGARRLPHRADHRAPALRPPQRHRHAAPRRLDRRGDRPRRLPGRRAGRRRAHRRRGLERGQRPRRRGRGPRGARARSCRSARQLGRLAMALGEGSSVDRVEVELLGRIAERDTRPLAVEVLLGVLTGHTEEDVNAVNAPAHRRGARDRADRDARHPGARLRRPRAREPWSAATSACAWSARRSAAATARTCSRPGGSASTSSSRTTSRCSATATCPGMIGRVGTVLRRERHQHLLGGRRATCPRTATRTSR